MVYRKVLFVGEVVKDTTPLIKGFLEKKWGYYDVESGTDASSRLDHQKYDAIIMPTYVPGISSQKILEKANLAEVPTIVIGESTSVLTEYVNTTGVKYIIDKSKTSEENLPKDIEQKVSELFSQQSRNINRIGIIGTGKIGSEVANRLVEYEGLASHIFLYNGKNTSRAEAVKSSLNVHIDDKKRNIETYVCDNFKDLVENCGIIVCSLGKADREKSCTSRMEVLQFYIDPLIELAQAAKDKDNVNMIMVTNPPNPLSLVYHIFSNGAKVESSSAVDSKRARYIISEWAKQYLNIQEPNVSATVIGPHSENMFITEAKINGVPLEVVGAGLEKLADDLKRPDYEEYHKLINSEKLSFTNLLEKTAEYGNRERKLNEKLILPLTPGQGVIDQIKAIIENGRITTGIHKLLDKDYNFKGTRYENKLRDYFPNGFFLGWPVEYNDYSAYPSEIRLTADQKEIFYNKLIAERTVLLEGLNKIKAHPEIIEFFFTEQEKYRKDKNGAS